MQPQQNVVQQNLVQAASDATKKIGNIQISAVAQPTINATATPLVQVKRFELYYIIIFKCLFLISCRY